MNEPNIQFDNCPFCGAQMLSFESEAHDLCVRNIKETVDGLNGWKCVGCTEILFDAHSNEKYVQAGDRLVLFLRKVDSQHQLPLI